MSKVNKGEESKEIKKLKEEEEPIVDVKSAEAALDEDELDRKSVV